MNGTDCFFVNGVKSIGGKYSSSIVADIIGGNEVNNIGYIIFTPPAGSII